MRIAANLGPTGDWRSVLEGARRAEEAGFEAVSLLDHYHSERPDWGYLSGWALFGALAMATSRIKLVPMVVDRMNYLPGVLAKETSVLSIISDGRFELGIGAGDFLAEQRAWGLDVPGAGERISTLRETVLALRQVWGGGKVTIDGTFLRLRDAACTPPPPIPPRVVVGAGRSRTLIRSAARYADEVNVYAVDELVQLASREIEASGRNVALSVYVWDWPDRIEERLVGWARSGVARVFLTFWPPYDQMDGAHELLAGVAAADAGSGDL